MRKNGTKVSVLNLKQLKISHLGTNLVSALAGLDVDDFPHVCGWVLV